MSSSVEQALKGLVGIFTMSGRPNPDPASLGTYRPNLVGLSRDADGIIMQLSGKELDGGDSAHRTGVLAFCNSPQDQQNLPLFIVSEGLMTRHPEQEPWNNPNNCTRDQLTGYVAGCWRAGRANIPKELLVAHAARVPPYTCQDIEADVPGSRKNPPIGDPLGPHDIMYLRICAGDPRAALDLASQLMLYLAIVTAPQSIDTELNQLLLQAIVCGQLDIFTATHSNYAEALHKYWSGEPWRGQRSIAQSLIDVVNLESAKYTNRNLLDLLLPKHLLEELGNLDIRTELKAFIEGNPTHFAELSARFIIAALRDIQDSIELLVRSIDTLDDVAREITVATIVALRSLAKDVLHDFSRTLEKSNVDPTGITSTILSVTAAVLGFGSSDDNEENREFRLQVTLSLNEITRNTQKTLDALAALQKSMEQHFANIAAQIHEDFYLDSLTALQGAVDNANLLLAMPRDQLSDRGNADRLRIRIDEIRTLIFSFARRYKAGVIGYCFQAYGIVVALMNAAHCTNEEVTITRKEYGQGPFKTMLNADDGPIAKLANLQQIEKNEAEKFKALLVPRVIGVISVQQTTQYFPRNNQGEPITVGLNKWDNTAYIFSLEGSVDQPALVKYMLTDFPFTTTRHEVGTIAAAQAQLGGHEIATDAHFFVVSATLPPVGSREEIDAAAKAMGDSALKSAQQYVNSRRMQSDYEALITGVKAAFEI